MNFTLQFDRLQRILLITMGTVVTEESVTAASRAVRSFLAVEDAQSVIADLSLVERIKVSTDFVWYTAARLPALPPGRPCVLVAPKDATFGMSRMFQILRHVQSLEVVHNMKEALELLGVTALNFEYGVSASR